MSVERDAQQRADAQAECRRLGKACGMFRQRTLGWWIGKTIRLWGRMQLVVKPAGWRNGCGAAVVAGTRLGFADVRPGSAACRSDCVNRGLGAEFDDRLAPFLSVFQGSQRDAVDLKFSDQNLDLPLPQNGCK